MFVLHELLANSALQIWLCLMNLLRVSGQVFHFLVADLALLHLHSMVAHVSPNTFFRVENFSVQITLEFFDFSAFVPRC
jgi:hypothetical protein